MIVDHELPVGWDRWRLRRCEAGAIKRCALTLMVGRRVLCSTVVVQSEA